MRITHISTAAAGGAGIAAFRLHQKLMKQPNIQSSFIQRFHLDKDFMDVNNIYEAPIGKALSIRIRKKFNIHTEHYHWVRLKRFPSNYETISFPTTSYRLEELPIIKNADIIHLHWVAEFLNYPTFFKNIKKPIIWTLHDMNPFMGLFHYKDDVLKNQAIYRKYDEKAIILKQKAIHKSNSLNIVSPSKWLMNLSESSQTFYAYPHYLIPNGLDISLYPLLEKKTEKEKQQVDNNLKTILFVANGVEIHRKGFDLLASAINKLNREDYNLISVGGDKITINSKINHIHYNYINDIKTLNSIYAAADLTILPSREDNLPNVMLESFANGTPVMSFSNGGMVEHVKTGENGILLSEIGIEPLTQGLNDFLNNKYTFEEKEIRDYAINTFSDTIQTQKYIQLYKDILNR